MLARRWPNRMTPEKRARIEAAGFQFATIQRALGLTDDEMAEVDAAVADIVTNEEPFDELIRRAEADDSYDAQAEMDLLLIRDLYGDD